MPKLINNERSPFTDVIILTAADLAAIGGSTKVIAKIPSGGAIEFVAVATGETFATAGSAVAATGAISIGDGTTAALFSASAVPPATVGTIPQYNSGSGFTGAGTKPVGIVAGGSNVVLTVAAGNYSALDAGKIVIGLRIIDPVQFAL